MRISSQALLNRRVVLQAVVGAGAAAVAEKVLPGGVSLGQSTRPDSVAKQNYRIVQISKSPLPLIVIWLGGGASHIDSFNLPPQSPNVSTGPFRPTRTSVPGVLVSEQLPRAARLLNRVALFNNITHNQGDHGPATALFFTGNDRLTKDKGDSRFDTPIDPNAMALAAKHTNTRYFTLNANKARPPYSGIEGNDPNSFSITCSFGNDNVYPSPLNGGVQGDKLNERIALLRQLQRQGDLYAGDEKVARFVEAQEIAIDTVTGRLGSAFSLDKTDPRVRDMVGRNPLGNGILVARNLINAGARFVTLNDGFYDTHADLPSDLKVLLPRLDYAFSGLLEMIEKGMIEEDTMVVIATEFGRAPYLTFPFYGSFKEPGREHWPLSSFAVVFGPEDVVEPCVIGKIDSKARFPDGVIPYQAHKFWEAVLNGCGYAREKLDGSGKPTGEMFPTLPLFKRKAA